MKQIGSGIDLSGITETDYVHFCTTISYRNESVEFYKCDKLKDRTFNNFDVVGNDEVDKVVFVNSMADIPQEGIVFSSHKRILEQFFAERDQTCRDIVSRNAEKYQDIARLEELMQGVFGGDREFVKAMMEKYIILEK